MIEMKLRSELMPPVLDEEFVQRLASLADRLDGCQDEFENCDELLKQFNVEANTNLQFDDFHGVYGGMEHEEFVRLILNTPFEKVIPDISYDELLELTKRVCNVEDISPAVDFWRSLLRKNVHSKIGDLIFGDTKKYFGDDAPTPKQILDKALSLEHPTAIPLPPSTLDL